jgi:hypothetical protein
VDCRLVVGDSGIRPCFLCIEYSSLTSDLHCRDSFQRARLKSLQRPVEGLRMHQVSLSSRAHRQRSSIIPITEIVRSCHLIPVFGRKANPGWTSATVLDLCPKFYLNPYLRHHDFYLLRYLVDRHAARKAAEERRVRIRALGRAGRHN